MTPRSLRIAYWTATIVFALLLALDGLGGITRAVVGDTVELIFPVVFLAIMAVPYWLWLRARQSGIVA